MEWFNQVSKKSGMTEAWKNEFVETMLKNAASLFVYISSQKRVEKELKDWKPQPLTRIIPWDGYLYMSQDRSADDGTVSQRIGYSPHRVGVGDVEFTSEGLSFLLRPVKKDSMACAYLVGPCYTKHAWAESAGSVFCKPKVSKYKMI